MLKQIATVEDCIQAKPVEVDVNRRILVGTGNLDEIDFENRWTPVAFTLVLKDDEGEA